MEDKSVKDIIKKDIHLKLNQIELTEDLYNLLSENSIQHTSNKNGIFLNISVLDDTSLLLLHNYVQNDDKKEDKIEDEIIEYKNVEYEKKEIKKIHKKGKTIKLDSLQEKIISFSL